MALKQRIKKLIDFLMHDIFRVTENELGRGMRILVRLLKKIVLSVRGFIDDDLTVKSSALTYYTALAVVPVFALILAIGRGFGFQDNIEDFVVGLLGTNEEFVPIVMGFVNNYLEYVGGGVFVGIGVALLLWTVVQVFRQIERNFNRIWNVKKNRSIVRQFTTYITVLVIVPLLIILSGGLNGKVGEWVDIVAASSAGVVLVPLYQTLLKLSPFVVYWILLTVVFVLIPNTKVKFTDALLSGIITGTAVMVLQTLYLTGQMSLSKYNAVYGSFAAVPLLLFWLQITWLIVLYGAELCYVSQNLDNYSFEHDTKNITRRYHDYTMLVVLKVIVDSFCKAAPPVSASEISGRYNIPIRLVNDHVKLLADIGLVSEITVEAHAERVYQPAMDVELITLKLIFERLNSLGSENFKIADNESFARIWSSLQDIQHDADTKAGTICLRDL